MSKRDIRVDAYIQKSAEFARPVLGHLRKLVHKGCPGVEETLKWSMPFFVYKGILCMMAAFKAHAAFGFWKSKLVLGKAAKGGTMGAFGRITSLKDLPSDKVLLGYIRKAAELNETGPKKAGPKQLKPGERRIVAVPAYLAAALKTNKKAKANFKDFSYSNRKEYIEWLTGAKRDETREKRLSTAIKWVAAGKSLNWRYERC
jgi:uncharacterized protein YdeI (YjbR/CyaY-like superfamily)